MSDPWFKFYPSDWLGGTRGLTAAETGIYVTLIAMMYERRGPIDLDMARLARLCGCPAGAFKRAIEGLIDTGKIVRTDRGLWNMRVEIEIQDREVASRNGSDAAQRRWSKEAEKTEQKQASQDATASDPQCDKNAMPEARSQIPEEDKKTEPNGSAKKGSRRSRLPDDWSLPDDWASYAEGKGLSAEAIRREAERFSNHHRSKGSLMADWAAAWRTWVGNVQRFAPRPQQPADASWWWGGRDLS